MAQHRGDGAPKTGTVRMDSDLIEKARIVCANRRIKLVDFLDELVRDAIESAHRDYLASAVAGTRPAKGPDGE